MENIFIDPDMENIIIDPEAKGKVDLIKINRDSNGNPYFIGKLQLPCTMDFEFGASFMVFNAEEGCEQLQFAPLDNNRRNKITKDHGAALLRNGRFAIDLHQMIDQNGKKYYVGEAIGLSKIDLRPGIFFTIFTSIPGQEQIQISRLQAKPKQRHSSVSMTFG